MRHRLVFFQAVHQLSRFVGLRMKVSSLRNCHGTTAAAVLPSRNSPLAHDKGNEDTPPPPPLPLIELNPPTVKEPYGYVRPMCIRSPPTRIPEVP